MTQLVADMRRFQVLALTVIVAGLLVWCEQLRIVYDGMSPEGRRIGLPRRG